MNWKENQKKYISVLIIDCDGLWHLTWVVTVVSDALHDSSEVVFAELRAGCFIDLLEACSIPSPVD